MNSCDICVFRNKGNNEIIITLCSGAPGGASSVTTEVFMSSILNLVFREKTNCTGTEIELRSLNAPGEMPPMHNPPSNPPLVLPSECLNACCNKCADAE